MGIIINDNNKCECGAYWQTTGYCCNGHSGKIEMTGRIVIEIDCINCPIQKDEELFLEQEIRKLLDGRGMKLKRIFF